MSEYLRLHSEDLTILSRLVNEAIRKGWSISVHDGEEYAVKRATKANKVLAALAWTDMDDLIFRDVNHFVIGFVSLVYGNEPGVVISDHSDNDDINALVTYAMREVE